MKTKAKAREFTVRSRRLSVNLVANPVIVRYQGKPRKGDIAFTITWTEGAGLRIFKRSTKQGAYFTDPETGGERFIPNEDFYYSSSRYRVLYKAINYEPLTA